MANIIKTTKIESLVFALLLTLVIPAVTFASKDNSGSFDFGGGWSDYTYGSGDSYYYDTPSYDYSYDYTPSYSSPSYDSYGGGSYGGYSYPTSSYGGSSLGGSSYYPSYGSKSSYPSYSYGGSSIPSTSYSSASSNPVTNSNATNDTKVTTTSTGGNANSVATGGSASSTNINNNVNNNNVYVYTTPTGNAVTYNPSYQRLDGYCVITPSSVRVGQTVTATAYITGGIGSYTYTWGGDLSISATGVSTSFTSYNPGTKTIIVTARSGEDVVTRSCSVTFDNYAVVNSTAYTSSVVTSGTPVSGVFIQPSQIRTVSTGSSISGVYLNDLPATGMDLNWMHYMAAVMIILLAGVMTFISKSKAMFVGSSSVE